MWDPVISYAVLWIAIQPHVGSRVRFINPRRPTRSPSWVLVRVISSYTVQYGLVYESPCRNIRPTLPHIGSHVSFINPRRPIRSPLWFPVWGIASDTAPYGFLYGPPCRQFLPCRLTWVPARDLIVSYAFPWIPIDSHAIPC